MLYTFRVIRSSISFMVFLSLCLLSMQVSGLHIHASLEGNSELFGTHMHDVGPKVHEHEGHDRKAHDHAPETDLSLFELAAGWAKLIPFLLLFAGVLHAVIVQRTGTMAPITKTFHPSRFSRWRPPLRAPPLYIS